jgi:hypothetical protein
LVIGLVCVIALIFSREKWRSTERSIKMEMSEAEIVKSYNEAAFKGSQIGILADLNGCKPSEIHAILEKHGIDITKPENKKTKRGRKPGQPNSPKKKQQKVLTEVDKKLLSILEEGIVTIDAEIQKHQEVIDELNKKRLVFTKFQEEVKS